MKTIKLIEKLNLTIFNNGDNLDIEITGAYTSDLLSDVIKNGQEGMVWITIQAHINSVAVASMKNLAAIILTNGESLDLESLKEAKNSRITILGTTLNAFEISGKIYQEISI